MQIEDFMRRYPDIKITNGQVTAAQYLESQGKRFLIDFGYANAEQMARESLERQIAELPHV